MQVGDLVRFKDKSGEPECDAGWRRRCFPYFFEVGLVLGPYLNGRKADDGETPVMFPSDTDYFITDMLEVLSESA